LLNGASITSVGAVTFNDNVTLGADLVLDTTNAAVLFNGTVNSVDTNARDLTVNAGSGNIRFASTMGNTQALDAVALNSTGETRLDGSLNVGSLTTNAGGTSVLNGGTITSVGTVTFNDNVTLGADLTIATTNANVLFGATVNSVDTSGRDLTVNAGSGNIRFASTVGATQALDVVELNSTGDTRQDGSLNVGSLTTNAGGTSLLNGGSITSVGAVTFNDNVTLGADLTIATTNANVLFGATVNSADATARDLTVNAGSGNIRFASTVGATQALDVVELNSTGDTRLEDSHNVGSLATNAGGTSLLNGGTITSVGAITFNDNVTLGADLVLGTTNAAVLFNGTLNSADATARDLTVNAGSGNIRFASTVGATQALDAVELNSTGDTRLDASLNVGSLTTNTGGTSLLNGGTITSVGAVTFNDNVTLGADLVLGTTNAAVLFNGTVNSVDTNARDVTVNVGSGNIRFASTVGDTQALDAVTLNSTTETRLDAALNVGSLTTNAGGTSVLNGSTITSVGAVAFNDAVTLGTDLTIATTNATVLFNGTVNSADATARDLTVNAGSGNVRFASTMGNAQALDVVTLNSTGDTRLDGSLNVGSLTTNAGGTSLLNGGSITSVGAVTLNDNVTMGADLTIATTNANVLFGATVNSADATARDLTVNAGSGNIRFASTVGATQALDVVELNSTGDTRLEDSLNVGSLTTNTGGTSLLNGSTITSVGAVTFNDAVTLGTDLTITTTNAAVLFNGTVNSVDATARDLTVNAGSGNIRLASTMGNAQALDVVTLNSTGETRLDGSLNVGSLTTNAGGTSLLNGSTITSVGAVTLNDNVTLGADLTIATTNANILFGATVNSADAIARDLTVNAGSGNIRFASTVGDTQALDAVTLNSTAETRIDASLNVGSLTTNAGGTSLLNGSTITSVGAVTFNDNVTLGADLVMGTTNAAVLFNGTVNSVDTNARDVTVNAGSGNIRFASIVGDTQALDAVALNSTGDTRLDGSLNVGSLTTNAGGTSLLNGGSITSVGAVTLNDNVTLGADLTIATTNANVLFGATVNSVDTNARDVTVNAGSGNIRFASTVGDNQALDAVALNSSSETRLDGSMNVGSLTTNAGGTLALNAGTITASGVISLGEAATLERYVTLTGVNVTLVSTVNGAQALTITDAGSTTLSAALGGVTPLTGLAINSASLQMNAVTVAGNAVMVTGSGLQFNDINIDGNLSVTTGSGGVSQIAGSTMTVTGNAVFTADTTQGQDAALDKAGNDFQGTVAFRHANNGSWRDVAIVDSQGALALADVATTGRLDIAAVGAVSLGSATSAGTMILQTNGNVTQAGPLVVTGAATIDAGTGTVALADSANNFGSTLTLTAASASVVDGVGGLELGDVQITVGALSVQSDRGAIIQSAGSSVSTAGGSSFIASLTGPGTAAADIELSNASNNFGGTVDLDGAAVSVVDTGTLQLGDVRTTGNLAITAAGNVSMDFAQVGGTMNIDTGSGNMTLGQVTVTGNTSIVTQGGSIAQTGVVQLQADVNLDTDNGSITLSNPANSFGGQLMLDGGTTTIANSGNLTLGTVTNRGSLTLNSQGTLNLTSATTVQGDLVLNSQGALNLGTATIDGSLSLNSGGGDVTIGNASVVNNLSAVSGGGAIQLGAANVQGNLALTSSGGGITQTAAFNVSGTASVDAGSGSVNLSNAGNDFVGAVSLTAGTATIADSNALLLDTTAITGNLSAQAQGDLTLGSGQVGGTLTAASTSGDITQQPAGLAVAGQMDLTAATGRIVLDSVANGFDGTVNASAAWVELRAASALTLGTLLATDAALVRSTGLLTLGQVTTTNDFSASGATGVIQLAATSLNIGGETSFVSTGGDVVLDQPANQFAGAMTLEANVANIQSASALMLGDVKTSGDLLLQTSGGPITQAAASTLLATGKTTLVAKQGGGDAPITLANTSNNFVGAVAIIGSVVKLRDDTGSLKLGNIRTSGMLDAMARGGPIMFEPGTLQIALGGMILTPDPRPSGIDFPKVRPESLASSATINSNGAPASSASPAGRAGLTVMATEQSAGNTSGQSAVIKISEAPMWQATRNVIPVGKVVALDTAASNNRVIASASFEIVDGFASGMTTIEVGGGQAVPASVDNDSGKVTLNGERSVSDYDKAIRDIKLRMGADVPPNAVFRIKITLTDQSGKTESKTVTLQVNQPEVVSRNP
jgi:hypothetical protein